MKQLSFNEVENKVLILEFLLFLANIIEVGKDLLVIFMLSI